MIAMQNVTDLTMRSNTKPEQREVFRAVRFLATAVAKAANRYSMESICVSDGIGRATDGRRYHCAPVPLDDGWYRPVSVKKLSVQLVPDADLAEQGAKFPPGDDTIYDERRIVNGRWELNAGGADATDALAFTLFSLTGRRIQHKFLAPIVEAGGTVEALRFKPDREYAPVALELSGGLVANLMAFTSTDPALGEPERVPFRPIK